MIIIIMYSIYYADLIKASTRVTLVFLCYGQSACCYGITNEKTELNLTFK